MDIEGSSYHWDSSAYPDSDSCMLKIVASDGFNSAEDTTESVFSLADKSPFVAILSPENNSIFGKEEEIYYRIHKSTTKCRFLFKRNLGQCSPNCSI